MRGLGSGWFWLKSRQRTIVVIPSLLAFGVQSSGCCWLQFDREVTVDGKHTTDPVLSHHVGAGIVPQGISYVVGAPGTNEGRPFCQRFGVDRHCTAGESDMATPNATKDAIYPCPVPKSASFSQRMAIRLPRRVWPGHLEVQQRCHHQDEAR